jgi:sensor domain CHASE-containing protein/nitrogen-specific signal transduction histidine kinase
MSIRKKTLIIVGLAFCIMLVSLSVVSKTVVLKGFSELEQDETLTNLKRGINEISNVLAGLNSAVGDWAPWDDTYKFIQDRNEEYLTSNLSDSTLVNLGINFVLFINNSGQVVYPHFVDLAEETGVSAPPGLVDKVFSYPELVKHAGLESRKTGIIMMPTGPVLIASRPIVKSDDSGPVKGTMVMGKYLDSAELNRLSEIVHLSLSIHPVDDPRMPSEFQEVKTAFSEKTKVAIHPRDNNTIAGFTILRDISGDPAFMLKVEIPRKIYNKGKQTLNYYIISLLGIGLVFTALITLLLEKIVLSPVSRLSSEVSDIGKSEDHPKRLSISRSDELGRLAGDINLMLEQLSEARRKLTEQSYQAGMSEMASGVIHNVRNSLNSFTGNLVLLRRSLNKAPIKEIELAQNELDEGTPSEARRKELIDFSILANKNLTSLFSVTEAKLDETIQRIADIEEILDDHQKWAYNEKPNEQIVLEDLVHNSAKIIEDNLKEIIAIEIDSTISEVGSVKGHRVSLKQIFGNLLLNAAESIQRKGLKQGRIDIRAAVEKIDGNEMKHVRISDNGTGIETDVLDHIFEQGFTTKQKGTSGIGLHWCANTINSMNGRIYAESEGPGKGACIHVLIP